MITKQVRRPLVGLAAHEAIEVLEAHSRRPLVVRSSDAVLIGGRVVILAEPRRGVTVILEDRADAGVLQADDRVIARVTGGELADHAETDGLMVTPVDQSRPPAVPNRR